MKLNSIIRPGSLRNIIIVQMLLIAFAGCSDSLDPGDGADWSPSVRARELVAEIVQELVGDAQWVSNFTHPGFGGGFPDMGFVHSLVGTDEEFRGIVTLVPDLMPGPYAEYCSDDGVSDPTPGFWEMRNRCLRVFKEEGDSWRLDVYFTVKPHRLPDDPHEFRYLVQNGEIVYQPNPLIGWRGSVAPDGGATITSSVDRQLRFIARDGEELDLTHMASVEAAHENPNQTTDRFELTFSSLAPDGNVNVELEVGNFAPFAAEGVIQYRGNTVADVAGTADDLLIIWR